jgi:hypothetical protein
MSVFHENMLIGSSGQGAPAAAGISRSLRFNSSDSAYLSRTPASAGNRKTWTWAGWVKRTVGSSDDELFSSDSSDGFVIRFVGSTSAIRVYSNSGGGLQLNLITSAVYRDPSAWYHLLIAIDTTQATAANRAKIYVNGVEVTAFSTSAYPSQNTDLLANQALAHYIGKNAWGASGLNAYLADIYFIDGQALTPSSFTETDATTGQLIPKAYTGSYGTNGFHLEFADNSSNTATTLGKDTSGNGNNWTPNNLSVTAGAGNDSLVDVPTNGSQTDTGVGGEVRGNYCTWNPLYVDTSNNLPPTFSNGNLDVAWRTSDWNVAMGTFRVSTGKWYWEMTLTAGNRCMLGISKYTTFNSANAFYYSPDVYVYFSSNGNKWNNNTQTAYGASFVQGDVIGVALDMDAGTIVFYKNGVSQGTAFSSLSGNFTPVWGTDTTGNTHTANFGQRPFVYTAPSGFKALNTANLPAPLVTKPNTVMDVKLYTGNGSTNAITGLGFSPDFVWLKRRNLAASHNLFDIVRGATKFLGSDGTNAEQTGADRLTSFDSTGFTLGSNAEVNNNNDTYVGWAWDAGEGSAVSNTQGSITSSVRANATAGFSIIGYTGTGSNATVGHGLGVTPGLLICKSRTQSGGSNWVVWHSLFTGSEFLRLNTTDSKQTASVVFNSTAPSSTVISLGTDAATNGNGNTHIIYAFAPVVGYSSAFSISGNGSVDGPFCFLGFRPRFLIYKRTDVSGDRWLIWDAARNSYNQMTDGLFPNLSNAELNGYDIDFLSNGFKLRDTESAVNASGGTYIGFAFAESPFQYARAR